MRLKTLRVKNGLLPKARWPQLAALLLLLPSGSLALGQTDLPLNAEANQIGSELNPAASEPGLKVESGQDAVNADRIEVTVITCSSQGIERLLEVVGLHAVQLADSDKYTLRATPAQLSTAKQIVDFVNQFSTRDAKEPAPGNVKSLRLENEFEFMLYRVSNCEPADLSNIVLRTFPELVYVSVIENCVVMAGPAPELRKVQPILTELDIEPKDKMASLSPQNGSMFAETAEYRALGAPLPNPNVSGLSTSTSPIPNTPSNSLTNNSSQRIADLQSQLQDVESKIAAILQNQAEPTKQLEQLVLMSFDLRQLIQQEKLVELEERAAKIRLSIAARSKNREGLTAARVKELLNERLLLSTDQASGSFAILGNLGPTHDNTGTPSATSIGTRPNMSRTMMGGMSNGQSMSLMGGTPVDSTQNNNGETDQTNRTANNLGPVTPAEELSFLNACAELSTLIAKPTKTTEETSTISKLKYTIDVSLEAQEQLFKIAALRMEKATSEMALQKREIERTQELFRKGSISSREVDDSTRTLEKAALNYDILQTEYDYQATVLKRLKDLAILAKEGKPLFDQPKAEEPKNETSPQTGSDLDPLGVPPSGVKSDKE